MKLTIERAALLKSLGHVHSVVERRNTIPILSNVLLDARDGRLGLTATDMDLTIVEEVAAEVGEPGATTAPAHTLYDIVRKLPDGAQIELAVQGDGGQMKLTAGRSTFQLATLPKEDFPAANDGELPQGFTMHSEELRHLIDRTRFAISTEETRYYLNGIYLHATKGNESQVLRGVATDGHRLARFEMSLPDGAAGIPGVIIPRKTVNELRKLIDETEGAIEIGLSDTKVRFKFDSTLLTSKLIDGTFPDYERVIPSGNDKTMNVDCKVFAKAVDRVSTISTEKSRAVKLSLEDGTLTLSATSPENGSASEELEVNYGGERIEIGFNSRYLLDIAERIDGGEAEFSLSDSASPTIVRDVSDSSALYVLMPMRV
ncbi:DNA polymerase III subunit beta [Ferruginivarius sediminum]|uniref:Beta sliding clamp n=1 Tax=Ferruginivarius sediminum TaxID=2661937 RepID=A0A369TCS5_9PROT|nr:DNA polymerase III subunit beta [Ferruginivarius sediminum]RDD63088.1 DNA polymerase III subunit beta [Ferruginivarius sediminum]